MQTLQNKYINVPSYNEIKPEVKPVKTKSINNNELLTKKIDFHTTEKESFWDDDQISEVPAVHTKPSVP